MVVILHFNAVVGVIASAGRNAQRVGASPIVIREHGNPAGRAIQDLPTKSQTSVEPPIGLPAVDDPRLDLQLLSGENLDPHAGKKPWRVRGNIRRLVGPVIEVIKTEKTHVR